MLCRRFYLSSMSLFKGFYRAANGKHLNTSTSLSAVCHRWWHLFQLFEKLHLDEESQW